MRSLQRLLTGQQELGNSPLFWIGFLAFIIWGAVFPTYGTYMGIDTMTYSFVYVPMAMGLSLLWGYAGVLSFGQVAFFGVGGYMYGIIAGNLMGHPAATMIASFGGIAAGALLAVIFGYFVFYGRVQEWIVPILTLVLTLIGAMFMSQTAGHQWRVGKVLLGGLNGMVGIPPLQIGSHVFFGSSLYYLFLVLVVVLYLALRILANSHYGHVLVGMREDEVRTESLGYDVRWLRLQVFTLAGALASLSGVMYVQWGNYITPEVMDMLRAVLPVIWVAVGGRTSLIAVAASAILLNQLNYTLAVQGSRYALIILGGLLFVVMLFFPQGLFVELATRRRKSRRKASGGVSTRSSREYAR